jgi:hypothetical protein
MARDKGPARPESQKVLDFMMIVLFLFIGSGTTG